MPKPIVFKFSDIEHRRVELPPGGTYIKPFVTVRNCESMAGGGEKEFSLAGCASRFPLQSGATRCRQKSQPNVVVAQRHDRLLVSMKFEILVESVQRQGNNGTSSNGEIHAVAGLARLFVAASMEEISPEDGGRDGDCSELGAIEDPYLSRFNVLSPFSANDPDPVFARGEFNATRTNDGTVGSLLPQNRFPFVHREQQVVDVIVDGSQRSAR